MIEKLHRQATAEHLCLSGIPQTQICEYANDNSLHRFLEINHQIDSLRQEQERIIRLLMPGTKPVVFFDDQRRRISWSGGSVKLGKKSYLFVKTLWFGEHHAADFAELEESVWAQHIETGGFVPRRTVSTLVQHTQKNLTDANFPYKIEPVKNGSSRELQGFQLILLNNRDNHKKTFPLEKK